MCLALIVDGDVKLGVLGCPNLSVKFNDPNSKRGVLLYGVKGAVANQCPIPSTSQDFSIDEATMCQMKKVDDISQATFCESVESGHSSHEEQSQIAKLLGLQTQSVRMDSQAKYATLTRGDADIYLRLPVSMTYEEKIWVLFTLLMRVDSRIMRLGHCWWNWREVR